MSVDVEKRKLWKVSPSAIVTYRDCPRKWFEGYVLYNREPEKPFQLKGTAIHKALEVYMQTGEVMPTVTLPDPSNNNEPKIFETLEFVQVSIDHLPAPANADYWKQFPKSDGAGIMVEQHGELGSYVGGPEVTQYIDLIAAWKSEGKILDHKTRSRFLYNKTPAELAVDPQLIINAKWLFSNSDYKEVELCHNNLLTAGRPKCVPVKVKVDRAHVEKVWLEIMATVREMASWAELATDSLTLPPNTSSCDKYGGCFYREKCGFTKGEAGATGLFGIRKPATVGVTSMSTPANGADLLTQMLAGRTGAVTIPGAPPPANGNATAPAPAPAAPTTSAATGNPLAGILPQVAPAAAPAQAAMPPQAAPASAAPTANPLAALLGGLPTLQTLPTLPAAPAQAAPAPVAPAAAPAPVAASLAALLSKVEAAPPAPAPPTSNVIPSSTFQAAAVAAGYPVAPPAPMAYDPTSITPPDAPARTSTPAEVAAANASDATEKPADGDDAEEITHIEGTGNPVATSAALAVGPDGGPAKRKRRTKAEMEAARAAGLTGAPAVAFVAGATGGPAAPTPETVAAAAPLVTGPAPAGDPVYAVAAPPAAPNTDALFAAAAVIEAAAPVAAPGAPAPVVDDMLETIRSRLNTPDPAFSCPVKFVFVDCMPGKGWPVEHAPRPLDEFMAMIANNAAAAANVADYRMIRYESKAYLAASIRALMRGFPAAVFVDSNTPGADEFLTQVIPYASMVVRGV